nr:MAG TPA: hypothetical protein [Bacteriophage sp.]
MNEAYFMDAGEQFLAHHGVKGMKWGVKRGAQLSINYHKKSGELQIRGAKAVGRGVVKGAKAVGRGAKKVNGVVNRPLTDKERKRLRKVGAAGTAVGLALAGASVAVGRSPQASRALGQGTKAGIKVARGTYRIASRTARSKNAYRTAARAAAAASAATHNRTYRNTATVVRGVRELTR